MMFMIHAGCEEISSCHDLGVRDGGRVQLKEVWVKTHQASILRSYCVCSVKLHLSVSTGCWAVVEGQ